MNNIIENNEITLSIKENEMEEIWFGSDFHLYHQGICRGESTWDKTDLKYFEYITRDFPTIQKMNHYIINNINSQVQPHHKIFFMGDFSFGGIENIWNAFSQLSCKNIYFIIGNHDEHIRKNKILPNVRQSNGKEIYAQEIFQGISYGNLLLRIKINKGKLTKMDRYNFILNHYPISSWENLNKGYIHLHGHVHFPSSLRLGKGKILDVGLDGNNLKLYSLKDVIELTLNQPIVSSIENDHHSNKN